MMTLTNKESVPESTIDANTTRKSERSRVVFMPMPESEEHKKHQEREEYSVNHSEHVHKQVVHTSNISNSLSSIRLHENNHDSRYMKKGESNREHHRMTEWNEKELQLSEHVQEQQEGANKHNVWHIHRNKDSLHCNRETLDTPRLHKATVKVIVTRDSKVAEEELDALEVLRLMAQKEATLEQIRRKFDFISVPDWVQLHPLLGAYLSETFGTFAWVLTLGLTSVRNQSIFEIEDDTNITPIPIGFMFSTMVYTFAYIGGAHFNPAISIAIFLIRQLDLAHCVGYILCQLIASLAAGLVAMLIQSNNNIFVPSVSNSYVSSGIFAEMIFTFAIALVVLNIAYSVQRNKFFCGLAIGLTLTAGSASVGRISGGAFNPAAATGLQLAMCLAGSCDELKSFWIYWLAPVIGASLAALIFSQMSQPELIELFDDIQTQSLHCTLPIDRHLSNLQQPLEHLYDEEMRQKSLPRQYNKSKVGYESSGDDVVVSRANEYIHNINNKCSKHHKTNKHHKHSHGTKDEISVHNNDAQNKKQEQTLEIKCDNTNSKDNTRVEYNDNIDESQQLGDSSLQAQDALRQEHQREQGQEVATTQEQANEQCARLLEETQKLLEKSIV